jgi:hypothetical protein
MKDMKPMKGLDDALRFAIANRRLIEFTYHDARRVAEPHDYGRQKGTTKLLVFQSTSVGGGAAKNRSVRGWRLLELEKITALSVLDATFPGSRGGAHHQHYTWDEVYARVA